MISRPAVIGDEEYAEPLREGLSNGRCRQAVLATSRGEHLHDKRAAQALGHFETEGLLAHVSRPFDRLRRQRPLAPSPFFF